MIKSFATGDLIPSLIFWKSNSFIFVIDGAHRLSAIRAWVENDYGDGDISYSFFNREIGDEQKKIAESTRRLVEKEVGRYSDLNRVTEAEIDAGSPRARLASSVFTRSLHIQWIPGSQEVAEASFFKINSQGTPLDKTEELLLKDRRKSVAIAARSVVRSGTGHKYWSKYSGDVQREIEERASDIHKLLFQPELRAPIKTLDLPLGGTSSPVDALKLLIECFTFSEGASDAGRYLATLSADEDGLGTIAVLKTAQSVVRRMTGNDSSSLGLHPAVYFFTERGVHSRFLFLGTVKNFAQKNRDNNKRWFQRFTRVRGRLEDLLVERKSLINQGFANVNSSQRIDRVEKLMNFLVERLERSDQVDDGEILKALGLRGAAGSLQIIDAPKGFSKDVKSAVYLREALKAAIRCPICDGYLRSSTLHA